MNVLDKAIGFFAPVAGAKRARARHITRIYEGASVGRRATSWKTQGTASNAELMVALRPLRDRCRDLARNTPHATRMLDILGGHAVGNGLTPISTTGVDRLDKQVNQLWADWSAKADITGRMTFNAMQLLAVRSMIESGEVVARFIDRELTDKLAVPMQIQLLEADYIDQYRDGIYSGSTVAPGVRRSRLGVGLGEYDAFMGLWLYRDHPGEVNTIQNAPFTSDFCSADDLVHVYKILRPGQCRGVPWMAPILTTARDYSDFMDAANVKARVEACFTAFITNDDLTAPLLDQTSDVALRTSETNPNLGFGVSMLEPGMMKELRAGQDIKFANPTSTSQIEPIMLNNLQAMAAGVGCTYDQITGDLRQANYSSLRAGKLDFWKLVSQLQALTIIPQFCDPARNRFISRAILSGRLRPRTGGYPCDWIVPAKEPVDPKKDLDAEKNEVRAGRVTPQEYISSRGNDWRKAQDDAKAYFDRAHELGLTFDTDASKTDQRGRAPPAPKVGDPAADPAADPADTQDAQDAADDATDAADGSD